ncbi:thioredoxin domain-containing protein 11 [Eurytemora carolleeae]|uniref:thioredoxin domain-containing protein 11 n=1 Tax=Eurytemora carolleeae TaxID=1294199 RepID=UPI000C778511|nr:thioredoxin domain-containing protein 11 [Eurytemora carolleeae]|eukprot:XP_023330000.1 thioredoxin domain-containing protein 11-like [Eurytemora affinis]
MVESCDNANESAEFTATNNTTATGDTDVPVVPKKSYLYLFFKMVLDFLFIGFFLSSVLSYVENSNQPLIRAARKPEPFFAENSTVRDYWSGKVFSGFQDAAYYESSFFFFYAAWDRESQEARAEMEIVGQFFSESDVLIAAVNCWYPTSDCAKEFGGKSGAGNILPVFIFYPKLLNGIQYRGQTSAQHIIRYLL